MQRDIHKEVIAKCQQGDRAAQYELYRLYSHAMYNICRRMIPDDDDAKDLLQEVFIEVFGQIKKLNGINFFSAWIKRVTINKCLNALRKKRLFVMSLDEGIDPPEEVLETYDQDVMAHDVKSILHAAENLAPGARTVFNLYLFDGYDHQEIADILQISVSASKSQYCKAKAKIRNILMSAKDQKYGTG
ncbi:RNA polymerase sigma factor [Reichenbachiella agariperforans]|uniref:RNA polymerase sigma factor n=1 Tax=Reichenbachiella agariperforans TaxID=156994 RepID=UPI001C081329|nr:sigma-70 family RNA polymerase sigma factor [Reichenbachiella agariperforans]